MLACFIENQGQLQFVVCYSALFGYRLPVPWHFVLRGRGRGWMWKESTHAIRDHCGMDSLVFIINSTDIPGISSFFFFEKIHLNRIQIVLFVYPILKYFHGSSEVYQM